MSTVPTSTACPVNCTFPYWSVVPPTHCPHCGRCLGCGSPAPVYPQPWRPYTPPVYPHPFYGPTYTIGDFTVTTDKTISVWS